MKNIWIFTLFVLFLGFTAANAQQSSTGSQKSDEVPVAEQMQKPGQDASQAPEILPGISIATPMNESAKAEVATPSMLPVERDAANPPTEVQGNTDLGAGREVTPEPKSGYQGRTAADPPEEDQPIK
jgi:hypothetical protein